MHKLRNIAVTGGAGFIGSNFIKYLFNNGFDGTVVNIDKLTYAGNLTNLQEIDKQWGGSRYFFDRVDVCNYDRIDRLMTKYDTDTFVHFAAESHVDRSIFGPKDFVNANIVGTFTLLEAARSHWRDREDVLFHHISTDEVFGSLGESGSFNEQSAYDPRSPYSASKAASDHLVRAYHHTYGLPVTISNCSNNYGPYQFPEKLIPLMILNLLEQKPLPVYGDGRNVRDWLYVEDHVAAIWQILKNGNNGQTYNIGGRNELQNIELVNLLCERVAALQGKEKNYYKGLITFVEDRLGHDRRYAIDCTKIELELGWSPHVDFSEGLDRTITWYQQNTEWVDMVRSGNYRKWIQKNYAKRKGHAT